jgi:hypothetical protein
MDTERGTASSGSETRRTDQRVAEKQELNDRHAPWFDHYHVLWSELGNMNGNSAWPRRILGRL